MTHKKNADSLNVVIIEEKNVKTDKVTRVILFSTDLELDWKNIIDYYRLKFQFEFNFRYAQEVFKILLENTKSINIVQLFEKIPVIGRIHGEKKLLSGEGIV